MEANSSDVSPSTFNPRAPTTSIKIVKQPISEEIHPNCQFKSRYTKAKANELHAQHRSRTVRIIRCVLLLVHCSQCKDQACVVHRCDVLKRVTMHAKRCKRVITCQICRQVMNLSYCHARECQNPNCKVVFCPRIKGQLKRDTESRN